MALDLQSVLGQPATPEAAPAPTPAAPDEGGGIPDAVLEIPEMAAILQGTPPAVWVQRQDQSPEVQVVMQNKDALVDAGFGFLGSKDGQTVAFFNQQFVSPEEMQAADNTGKLKEFATAFSDLKASLSGASSEAAPSASAPPQMGAEAPSAGFEKKLATKRLKNLSGGTPSSGPAPGQGRLLNSILSPTV